MKKWVKGVESECKGGIKITLEFKLGKSGGLGERGTVERWWGEADWLAKGVKGSWLERLLLVIGDEDPEMDS